MLVDKNVNAELDKIYNPQVSSIKQKQKNVSSIYNPQRAQLKQAKINAFREIKEGSNTKGMYFSGFRPSEEARYTGERYLPALAGLKSQENEERTRLSDLLTKIFGDKRREGIQLTSSRRAEKFKTDQFNYQKSTDARDFNEGRRQFNASMAQRASAARSASRAPTKVDIRGSLRDDIAGLSEVMSQTPAMLRRPDYLDAIVIPQLIKAYPDLTASSIKSEVYGLLKS